MKNSKLKKWVDDFGGVKKVAKRLKVGDHQVRAWLRGDANPRVSTINEIIKISKEELTFKTIFKETSRNIKRT